MNMNLNSLNLLQSLMQGQSLNNTAASGQSKKASSGKPVQNPVYSSGYNMGMQQMYLSMLLSILGMLQQMFQGMGGYPSQPPTYPPAQPPRPQRIVPPDAGSRLS